VPATHAFPVANNKDVDGGAKPCHDDDAQAMPAPRPAMTMNAQAMLPALSVNHRTS
jgi:hypothetical protein